MQETGIQIDENMIMNCGLDEGKAYQQTKELMNREERPTAVFSFNGLMSLGFIQAVQEIGLSIPQDVSLLGFDEIQGYGIFRPKVTHVIQPIKSLGEFAFDMIAERIKKADSVRQQIFLKPLLIVGDSCIQI